jgi:catechol 2,3-dioxygenase-like lactoylglutathione lyase family enzyme
MPAIPVKRVAHCNVNCSSLERSRRFYEDVVGLQAFTHTNPAPQDAGGFALPGARSVQWDAWILHDHRGPTASPGLDLLEWKLPVSGGLPYPAANHLGFYRLCYLVSSVDAIHGRFGDAGANVVAPPATVWLDEARTQPVRVLCALDPDGTCLEFVEHPAAPATQAIHVNLNCSDLERSRAWYTANLGFEVTGHSAPGPQSGSAFGFAGDCEWEADFLSLPGQRGVFTVDLLQWKRPAPVGSPYARADNLGIYRLALVVDDIHACHRALIANGVSSGPPVELDMGPGVPVDGLWAMFLADPDGACVELIEEPR